MRKMLWMLAALFFAGCEQSPIEESSAVLGQDGLPTEFWASFEGDNDDTRTYLDEQARMLWTEGDRLTVFKATTYPREFAFTGRTGANAGGFRQVSVDDDFWFGYDLPASYAIYPHSEDNWYHEVENYMHVVLPAEQTYVKNSFGLGANTMIAVTKSTTDNQFVFKNVCSYLRVMLYGESQTVKKITFSSNAGEGIAGEAHIYATNTTEPICSVVGETSSITLMCDTPIEVNTTEEEPVAFWIVVPPVVLSEGYSVTVENAAGKAQTYEVNKEKTFKRNVYNTLRRELAIEGGDDVVMGGSESGFYLGIIGFNVDLYPYPIRKLTEESVVGFHSFIDGLSMLKGTLLYYAVDNSLDALQTGTYPSNLDEVAVVSFTDGLDLISIDRVEMDKGITYLSGDEYLEAIHTRLNEEKVSGQSITAYSIGVEGNDVTNTTLFQTNLEKIATSSDNVFKVTKMSEVTEKFTEIANQLSETKYVQTIALTAPGPNNQERVRFTFDNVSSYSSSKLYIEGTFNRTTEPKTLENITYVGLTSTSGSTITCPRDARGYFEFMFEGIQANNGKLVPDDYQQRWYTKNGIWEKDSEFDPAQSDWTTQTVKRSAAILLNLDCSSSLGTEFPTLQAAAKSFVSLLYKNSIDPNEVASISLNKSTLTMVTGDVETLTATVLPTTALDTRVEWSSTNASVASVSDKGVVTAVGPGTATIIAKTVDGGLTATCKVSVVTLAKEIRFDSSEVEIYTGESFTVQATVLPEDTSNKSLHWESSNTDVATVDENGTITPVKAGTATITATSMDGTGIKATCQVTVLQHVESITLDCESALLYLDDTKQLTATITPDDATNKKVVWSSSDETIASVDQKGLVTAHKVGKVQITAATELGDLEAVCEVEVIAFVSGIKLDQSELELYNGDVATLKATILPEDANNKTLSWSSSNPQVATVDENGVVTAIAAGTATITVAATDESGIETTCKVTVLQHVESVTLSRTSGSMYAGEAKALTATVLPENAANKTVIWSSSNTAVATVDQSGLVTAVKAGTAQITATTEEGGLTAVCDVTVNQRVTEIALNTTEATLYTKESLQLAATALPEDATNKTLSWSSADPTIASVDQQGVVSGLSVGTTTITVATQDGSDVTATCQVTVLQHVESVQFVNQGGISRVYLGQLSALAYQVLPENASNRAVTCTSSDESIATVEPYDDGRLAIRGVKTGRVQITVTTVDGGFSDVVTVDVVQLPTSIELESSTLSLYTNETHTLAYTVLPENAFNKSVVWKSSNPAVASVDASGAITGLSVGTATITATALYTSRVTATCEVTVMQHVTGISLSSSSLSMGINDSQTLTVGFSPNDASNTDFTVECSNTAVATVTKSESSIIIKAISCGSATITVTAEDGGYSATCEIIVNLFSQTPTHLALAVQKDGVRYFVAKADYANADLTGYTKEGIVIISSTASFIYDIKHAAAANTIPTTVTQSDAMALGTMPDRTQAQVIVDNWNSINSAIVQYGGTSIANKDYWTKDSVRFGSGGLPSGAGSTIRPTFLYYSYNSSGLVSNSSSTNLYYARKIIATL